MAPTSVNTVPFAPFPFPTNGTSQTSSTISNVFFQETEPDFYLFGHANTPPEGAFTLLTPQYRQLIESWGTSNQVATLEVHIGGLTDGQDYLVQVWSNISGSGSQTTRVNGLANGDYVDLSSNTSGLNGGLGQYAVGTFTATPTGQLVLQLNGQSGGLPNINALQIRAVPEPSTWVLGAGGLACAAWRAWRRKRIAA